MNGTKTNSFQVRFISVFSGKFSRSRRYDSIIDRGSKMTRVFLKLWSHFAIRLHLDMCSLEFKHKKLRYIQYPQQGSCQNTCCVHFQKKKTDALALQGQIPQLLPLILRWIMTIHNVKPRINKRPNSLLLEMYPHFSGQSSHMTKSCFYHLKIFLQVFPGSFPKIDVLDFGILGNLASSEPL